MADPRGASDSGRPAGGFAVRIYLTGFMGAGKSTVGAALARSLGWQLVDLDAEIERLAGATVREIFARRGEAEFRRQERELLLATAGRDAVVVATGGGTLADPANLAAAREAGTVVWLHPAFETLMRRIGPLGKEDRPLFRDETSAFALYRDRLPHYRAADLTVDIGPDETPAEIAARIRLSLRLPEAACST